MSKKNNKNNNNNNNLDYILEKYTRNSKKDNKKQDNVLDQDKEKEKEEEKDKLEEIANSNKDIGTNDNDNDNDKDNDKDVEFVSKEFKEQVIKYVKLDDAIKRKSEELAELKKQKKPCELFILKYMEKISVPTIEITNGKLKKNKAETKKPLSQDIIRTALSTKLKNKEDIDEVLNLMEENRPSNVNINLKRVGKNEKPIKTKK